MNWDTVVGIDWSGAERESAQRRGIWAATISDGRVESLVSGTREEIVENVDRVSGSVLAGIDFSFSFPRWFVDHIGCSTVFELWDVAAKEGESWLAECPWPFFAKSGTTRPTDVELFRGCERAVAAKSTFQIAGPGHVGTGSIRGMPCLSRLRAAGWAIWPFDDLGPRTVVEVYPREAARLLGRTPPTSDRDAFDAEVAALAMWTCQHELAGVDSDTIDMLEGAIWPTSALRLD